MKITFNGRIFELGFWGYGLGITFRVKELKLWFMIRFCSQVLLGFNLEQCNDSTVLTLPCRCHAAAAHCAWRVKVPYKGESFIARNFGNTH